TAGVFIGEPRAVTLGGLAIVYGVWVATRISRLSGETRERTITMIAVVTLAFIAVGAALQPSLATPLAIASQLPSVIVTPIVPSRIVLRLLILSGLVAGWSVLVTRIAPDNGIPEADPAEADYLASIGQRTMAMIPLVASGRTVGLIEITSSRRNAFDTRAVELATMLAGEAAMALENARLYDQIRHQALHDGLTGLANRVLFRDRVEQAVARSRRTGGRIAVLFIDLDDFKMLNDTHGHARGDEVLVVAARR